MIEWVALGLSVFNTVLWIVFLTTIRKLFKTLYPMFNAMGLMGGIAVTQNLTSTWPYARMAEPAELPDGEIDKN